MIDTIFFNGKITTLSTPSQVSALAVTQGRIVMAHAVVGRIPV